MALMYGLQQCETRLVDLLVEWRPFITRIEPAYTITKPWGPSWAMEKARRKAMFRADTVSVDAMHVDHETGPDPVVLSDAEEDEDYYEGAEGDARVMEELEIIGEQEEYVVEADVLEELTLPAQIWSYPEAAATPRKRRRTRK